MSGSITFSTAELVSMILGICAAIVTISAAIGVITKAIAKAKEPEAQQNARLEAIEKRLDEIDKTLVKHGEYFMNDDNRFKAIEKSNRVTQSSLLALLKHAISGGDVASLKEAERALEEYLLEK